MEEEPMTARTLILTAAGLALLAGAALAIEPSIPRIPRVFAKLDQNHDGKIALAEIGPKAEQRLLRYDLDKNGAVSGKEIDEVILKYVERRRDRILAHLDLDKDGAITTAELDKVMEAMFNGADANDDGGITIEEARDFKVAKWRKAFMETAAN
jgi:Ca2+-binding EF-hand superfamily protein